jgi:hypothetical protein
MIMMIILASYGRSVRIRIDLSLIIFPFMMDLRFLWRRLD